MTEPLAAPRPQPELAAAIDEVCAFWDREDSPGCVVAVVRDGEVLHSRGYGMADLERRVPLTATSVLDVGSLAKQFTAVCAALLAEQRKLTLGDDVRDYLPQARQYDARITVRHLVHHTSGVRDYLDLLALAGRRHLDASTADVLALLQRQQGLNFAPGAELLYSNSGYLLLAAVIARAAGCSLAEYAEKAIFRPLGMSSTRFEEGGRTPADDAGDPGGSGNTGDLALAYSQLADGAFTVDGTGINLPGDGALLTTADDLCRWERNFDSNRLGEGGPDLMRQVVTPGRLNSGEALDYAFGLYLGKLGNRPILYHGGTFAAYRAGQVRCPEARLSVLCLANLGTVDAEQVARQVAGLCLGEPERGAAATASPVPVQLDSAPEEPLLLEEMDEYTGSYHCDELNVTHQIELARGQLCIRMARIPFPLPLTPLSRDQFTTQEVVQVRFQRGAARRISGFLVSTPGVRQLAFSGPGRSSPERATGEAGSGP